MEERLKKIRQEENEKKIKAKRRPKLAVESLIDSVAEGNEKDNAFQKRSSSVKQSTTQLK